MKAALTNQYSTYHTLEIKEIQTPTIKPEQVLVKVYASTINISDLYLLEGKPFLLRFSTGLFKPNHPILGADISGIVTEIGSLVTTVKVGDCVICDLSDTKRYGYSEFALVDSKNLVLKPDNLSFEQSACLPLAGVTAYQGLMKAALKTGDRLLVSGASSGVGSMAVIIGKALGAHVTAMSRDLKFERIKALKADAYMNATTTDFSKLEMTYDCIFDAAAYGDFPDYQQNLSDGGSYIMAGGAFKQLLKMMLIGKGLSKKTGKRFMGYLAKANTADLQKVADLFSTNNLTPLMDSIYPLEEIKEAFKYYTLGKTVGKIVIQVRKE